MFLLYSPLNQGLKLFYSVEQSKEEIVFTLQSIKSRIETGRQKGFTCFMPEFLLYSPLNQGLKLLLKKAVKQWIIGFLLYSPLNQGLKRFNASPQPPPGNYGFYSTVH